MLYCFAILGMVSSRFSANVAAKEYLERRRV